MILADPPTVSFVLDLLRDHGAEGVLTFALEQARAAGEKPDGALARVVESGTWGGWCTLEEFEAKIGEVENERDEARAETDRFRVRAKEAEAAYGALVKATAGPAGELLALARRTLEAAEKASREAERTLAAAEAQRDEVEKSAAEFAASEVGRKLAIFEHARVSLGKAKSVPRLTDILAALDRALAEFGAKNTP